MFDAYDPDVERRWRALWDASPQRSPYSRLEYVCRAAEAAGLQTGVFFAEGDAGGAAITWRRRGPYREIIVPPFTPYSAVLLRDVPSEADVHARNTALGGLLRSLNESFHAVRLHLHPTLADVRPAQWAGWSASPLYTYVCSSPGMDAWSESAGRNFRNSRDEYAFVEDGPAAAAAIRLAEGSYARHDRTPPLSALSLSGLVDRLTASGLATAFAVRHKPSGDVHAAAVVLNDGRNAYYWIAGSRPGDGMTVLIGELLPRLFAEGIELFDFMGANTPGIAEFKRKFGTRLLPYYALTRCRVDLTLLRTLRNMWR